MAAKTKAVKRVEMRTREGNWLSVELGPHTSTIVHPEIEKLVVRAITGLLHVARTAMPDTYFASDSRVRRGQKLLAMFGRKAVR